MGGWACNDLRSDMLKLLCKKGLGGNMANVMAGPRPRSEELMKKKLTTLALVLFAALSMLALCACNSGPSSEEVIREGLSEEFDMIVNKKGDDWDEMISDIEDEVDLSMFDIDAEEFVSTLLDGFDYEITSVDVDEEDDTAVAHVTLTSKSMKDVMDALNQASEDFMSDPSNYTGLSEDEVYKKVGEMMMDAIRGVKTRDVDVDLECERDDDGNWTEADSVSDEITNALLS